MTVSNAIEMALMLTGEDVAHSVLQSFVRELEGRILIEIHGEQSADQIGEQLCVPTPYDKIYWIYLLYMLAVYHGGSKELCERYGEAFQRAYDAYSHYYRTHVPGEC